MPYFFYESESGLLAKNDVKTKASLSLVEFMQVHSLQSKLYGAACFPNYILTRKRFYMLPVLASLAFSTDSKM